jgi:hypothetical protein
MPKNESVVVRLEAGTLARIDDVLEKFEDRSDMLREAFEREIERRGKCLDPRRSFQKPKPRRSRLSEAPVA